VYRTGKTRLFAEDCRNGRAHIAHGESWLMVQEMLDRDYLSAVARQEVRW
jgi:hypothetical protein